MNTLINVAFPVFGIIVAGFLAGTFNVLGKDSAAALNRFVYYFALPPVLFTFTARSPIEKILNWPFLAAFVGGSALTLMLSLAVGRLWFGHKAPLLAVQGLTAVFSNTAYMGVPLFLTAFGPEGALPAIVATIAAITLLLGGTIAALETTRAVGPSTLQVIGQVARTLAGNPLLLAPLLGSVFSVLALPIPKPVGNFLDLLAASAGPGALFALGLSLVGSRLLGDAGEVTWLVILKLLVHPAITYVLAFHVFPMELLWAQAAVLLAALPVGALVFVVAQEYDVYVRRASSAVIGTTVLSIATLTLLLVAFGR